MKDKKKLLIGTLLILICIMAVGYALLAQRLQIEGTIAVESTWKVEITNITEKTKTIGASSKTNPSYTATTATFNSGLTSPGDYIIYEIEVTNKGTLDAILDSISTSNPDNSAIKYTITGIKEGNKLLHQANKKFEIKIEYKDEVYYQPKNISSNITLTMNYVEFFGNEQTTDESEDIILNRREYDVGDKVTFAGSDWYVIAPSGYTQDYVTLLKEKALTKDEMPNYNVKRTWYGTLTSYDSMGYYWSSTCNSVSKGFSSDYTQYGLDKYTNNNQSGCAGHNSYQESKIKEFLEGTYINTLDASKLKEIDGYKIRLITVNELQTNLGYNNHAKTSKTPEWVYNDFGDTRNGTYTYWTMDADTSRNYHIWIVYGLGDGQITWREVYRTEEQVRPVINLLKSAIQ